MGGSQGIDKKILTGQVQNSLDEWLADPANDGAAADALRGNHFVALVHGILVVLFVSKRTLKELNKRKSKGRDPLIGLIASADSDPNASPMPLNNSDWFRLIAVPSNGKDIFSFRGTCRATLVAHEHTSSEGDKLTIDIGYLASFEDAATVGDIVRRFKEWLDRKQWYDLPPAPVTAH